MLARLVPTEEEKVLVPHCPHEEPEAKGMKSPLTAQTRRQPSAPGSGWPAQHPPPPPKTSRPHRVTVSLASAFLVVSGLSRRVYWSWRQQSHWHSI